MGPRSAYLFFGRQTINEGLEREEAHQIGNLLTGPMSWVGQPASMLSSEYPLVEGRQAVAMAREQECKERVQVMCSEKSCRHIPESEWDWDWNFWSLSHQDGDLHLHICLEGAACWKPHSMFGIQV